MSGARSGPMRTTPTAGVGVPPLGVGPDPSATVGRIAAIFGLALAGDPVPGTHPSASHDGEAVVVRNVQRGDLAAFWSPAVEPVTLFERHFISGDAYLRVEHGGGAGFRIWCHDIGEHVVSEDGTAIFSYSIPSQPPWFARRLMAAQALPLAAVLQGREILHAAAVAVGDRAYAIVGPSGMGKTSTVAHMIASGAAFAADDGLALRVEDDVVRADPGPRMLNIAAAQFASISAGARPALGEMLGRTPEAGEVHLEPRAVTGPLTLGGLILLSRGEGAHTTEEVAAPTGSELLGSFHVSYLASPERLVRQLDVAAACAATPILRVVIGRNDDAPAVARRVAAWIGSASD